MPVRVSLKNSGLLALAINVISDEELTVDNPQSRSSVERHSIYHLRDDGFN